MTEEQLTQAAILKAQALKNEQDSPIVNPEETKAPIVPKTTVPEIIEEVKSTPEKKENEYKFSVDLGKNKKVEFRSWTGKTKKIFKNLVETAGDEDVDLERAMQVLIRDYISEPDVYLSDVEQQFLLIKIREASLTNKFNYASQCPQCNHDQFIESTTEETFKFKMGSYPFVLGDIEFVDIESNNIFNQAVQSIVNATDYDNITSPSDIEVAMHIKTKDNKSPIEVLDMIDDLDLKSLSLILDKLSETAPKLEMYSSRKCDECKQIVNFETDEIPDIFEELL